MGTRQQIEQKIEHEKKIGAKNCFMSVILTERVRRSFCDTNLLYYGH